MARENPARTVIFFAVGFETTAPVTATAVLQARHQGLTNFRLLVSHVRVPPALRLLLGTGGKIDGFLAPGHVCTVMGTGEYETLCRDFRVPLIVTGFEPLDILQGLLACLECLESGKPEVRVSYARSVRPEGSTGARGLMDRVFQPGDAEWRGIGTISGGGLALREEWAAFDAGRGFSAPPQASGDSRCQAGRVLRGEIKPNACLEFGRACTPDQPLGAPMVSGEGACAAWYRYRPPQEAAHG